MRLSVVLLSLTVAFPAGAEVETSAGTMSIEPVLTGLEEPWGLAFLPDGGFLVTERDGRLLLVRGGKVTEMGGIPAVFAEGQGGLLDVMVPRDFPVSREVWLSYAMPREGGGATAVGKGFLNLADARLDHFTPLYVAEAREGGRHFGARLVEGLDGTVFLTPGDRGTGPEGMEAQDPMMGLGKVVRLNGDGTPATTLPGWQPGVFSRGHRNVQGAVLDLDGRLLTVEHGAQGGDELNAPEAGRNYGWPVITYGENYGGGQIGVGVAQEGMEQPLHYWVPSIAPSGLMVYSGALVPEWRGDVFFGSLNSDFLGRLDPDQAGPGGMAEERIAGPQTGRVRDVAEAPDGSIWFLSVYDGAVYRMAPVE